MAAANGSVAVFGRSFDPRTGTGTDTVLRLYEAATGVLRWETRFDLAHRIDFPKAVAFAGPVVLTVGRSFNASNEVWIVSAYDVSSGALLWRDELQEGAGDFLPEAMAVRGRRVYVTGAGGASCSEFAISNCDWITRSYDRDSGALLWEDRYDAAGADDGGQSVATTEDVVIVGGFVGSVPNDEINGPSVRVLNARTGRLVWQDAIPDPTNNGLVFKVAARDESVFMAAKDNDDWLVRAYDAGTGRVRWTNT